jgi:hypothetical protein
LISTFSRKSIRQSNIITFLQQNLFPVKLKLSDKKARAVSAANTSLTSPYTQRFSFGLLIVEEGIKTTQLLTFIYFIPTRKLY